MVVTKKIHFVNKNFVSIYVCIVIIIIIIIATFIEFLECDKHRAEYLTFMILFNPIILFNCSTKKVTLMLSPFYVQGNRLREVRSLLWGHTSRGRWDWSLNLKLTFRSALGPLQYAALCTLARGSPVDTRH